MCIDMCVDMSKDSSIHKCIDIRPHRHFDRQTETCAQKCSQAYHWSHSFSFIGIDMSIHSGHRRVYVHVYRHVYRLVYRHAHRHVYRHVHRHVHGHVLRNAYSHWHRHVNWKFVSQLLNICWTIVSEPCCRLSVGSGLRR